MGIWIELGVFVLALAFGLWQIHDVKKAREASRRRAEGERSVASEPQSAPEGGEGGGEKKGPPGA